MVKMTGEDSGQVRVIDPEFTVYGPPGLDVGSLLSGYILAAVHHSYLGTDTEAKKKAVASITGGVKASWDAYKSELSKGGLSDDLIREIEVESVGFAVAEVCRTALGFAGIRLWLQFDEPKVKEAAVQKALSIVQKCMTARHDTGMQVLFDCLDTL
jgi:5-methylthioribose kinase